MYAYACTCICMDVYICVCVFACVCIYIYMYMHVCICIYLSLNISCMCSLFHLALGNEDGGGQLVYESACCLAWGAEGKIVVLSVSSLFLTRVGVYVCVSVCIRTNTHTLHRCSDVSPGVGMRHLEGPNNSDGLNLDIYIFAYVYKVHMCVYMLRGGMRSWTKCFFSLTYFFFRKRKAKIVNTNH